ncbi:MAG TPA: protein-signal peptide and transmembrane prediction, partial [Verrucomicrobiales bacterium]|nr:protein-signal peptide and transmembrane prediction [Verrucomicrobiales bacterium]
METSMSSALAFLLFVLLPTSLMADQKLSLTMRSRTKDAPGTAVMKKVEWEASRTALIICDMWDDHWCKSA